MICCEEVLHSSDGSLCRVKSNIFQISTLQFSTWPFTCLLICKIMNEYHTPVVQRCVCLWGTLLNQITISYKKWLLFVLIVIHITHSLLAVPKVLTWVQPAERSSWSHYVRSAAYKISSICNDDTVFVQQLVHTVQDTQRVQVPLYLLICLVSIRINHYTVKKISWKKWKENTQDAQNINARHNGINTTPIKEGLNLFAFSLALSRSFRLWTHSSGHLCPTKPLDNCSKKEPTSPETWNVTESHHTLDWANENTYT